MYVRSLWGWFCSYSSLRRVCRLLCCPYPSILGCIVSASITEQVSEPIA